MRPILVVLLAFALAGFSAPPADATHCGILESTHRYAAASTVTATSVHAGPHSFGALIVFDTGTFDCNGNGLPDDYDGDYDFGLGGGFFGIDTPENAAVKALCGLEHHLHPPGTLVVRDRVVPVVKGALGVELFDPLNPCIASGVATCVVPFAGSVSALACGGSSVDAGVWVFLDLTAEALGSSAARVEATTTGTITIVGP